MIKSHIFSIFALLLIIAGTYHVIGVFSHGSLPPSPIWRHFLFVLINIFGAFLLLRRPNWAYIPFSLITVQQIYSHGKRLISWWVNDVRIDIISIFVIVILPAITILLILEKRQQINGKITR
jgi:hypothetical protein